MTPPEPTPIGFEVLLSLMEGPRHGYGIKLDIEERTGGALSLGSGTLYQAIQRLEREGLLGVAADQDDAGDPRRGRSYAITDAGRLAVEAHLRRLSQVIDYAREHDLLPADLI